MEDLVLVKPQDDDPVALQGELGDRIAEDRWTAVLLEERLESVTNIVPGLHEVAAARVAAGRRLRLAIVEGLPQAAQADDRAGPIQVRDQLQAGGLRVLDEHGRQGIDEGVRDRIAEDLQPAVAVVVVDELGRQRVAGLWIVTAAGFLRVRRQSRRRQGHQDHQSRE